MIWVLFGSKGWSIYYVIKVWGGGGRPKYDDWSQFERGGGWQLYDSMTLWKKCKYTKRDQLNFGKDLSILQFDLKWSLTCRYGWLIKLNKIEVISTGLKMKALLIFMWNVKGGMSKYDNMMVIEGGGAKIWRLMTIGGVGVRQPSMTYDVIYGSSLIIICFWPIQ